MALGPWQLIIILVIVLVLFGGRGKISALMGDFGKGLKSFKKGMKDEESVTEEPPKAIDSEQPPVAEAPPKKDEAANG